MMCLHEREMSVQRAHLELTQAFLNIAEKYGLTYGEIVAWHAAELGSTAKYMIRRERHDDPNKPGGLE